MKTITKALEKELIQYHINLLGNPSDILFMDIETTGFAARSSVLYLIGCVDFDAEGNPRLTQFFAEKPEDEAKILSSFLSFLSGKKMLIHYNGNNFDIPYLKHKCQKYGMNEPFSEMSGVDIYKRVMPYKTVLGVENLKQKTMEKYLSIEREDAYNGGELINVYRDYVAQSSLCEKQEKINPAAKETAILKARIDDMLSLLLLHNSDDMRGMMRLLSLLSYADIFLQPTKVTKVSSKKLTEPDGTVRQTLLIRLRLTSPLPKALSVATPFVRINAEADECTLEVAVLNDELKYFYGNYKDYYYLPDEDMAMHKSVAAFVAPERRMQANAQNCYTRKEGSYLPEWELCFEPVFKQSYESKTLYFELTDEMRKSPADFKKYADHLLDYIFHNKK